MTQSTIRVAAIQMVSGCDVQHNIQTMRDLVRQAADLGANWVLLPEYWALLGHNDTDKLVWAEPFGNGLLQDIMAQTAREYGVVLFGGSIPLQSSVPNKVRNSMLVYAPNGKLLSCYDKIHLFGFSGNHERYAEADTICAGHALPKLQCDNWHVAQGICYDLRFPEFFRAQTPFDVLMLPAAFTYTTGQAHWHLLLRTRAVENQCYVIAAGQGGQHENGRRTYGHSIIIDPWGEILAELPENKGVIVADMLPEKLHATRTKLPALQHRVF
ncbi:MAG: carbon-nitrogen hydrolase family protein [Alysiella sp.]|uniref:carbon-nitrogen hydrolase family protein n=1 Tax=Alysiella sp. TaxID=1872483 RepID=UPI0026DB2C7C|nr:carbon-nitrogen hydrolase family protein [Alysiella sp.]MDO4433462.1 carbon-nitrogen hydrolase family protein [Alysiella sp.]